MMNKKQKVNYINEVAIRFEDSRNHGNGNSWWYPISYRMAYDVKMSSFGDVEELRKYLSKKQDSYYTNEGLQDFIDDEQEMTCEMLKQDIEMEFTVDSVFFAGRSGGWVEVQYINEGVEEIEEDNEEIEEYYKIVKTLEQLESDIHKFIKKRHKEYNNYVDSKQYYKDISESLMVDSDINAQYKEQIQQLKNKLK